MDWPEGQPKIGSLTGVSCDVVVAGAAAVGPGVVQQQVVPDLVRDCAAKVVRAVQQLPPHEMLEKACGWHVTPSPFPLPPSGR